MSLSDCLQITMNIPKSYLQAASSTYFFIYIGRHNLSHLACSKCSTTCNVHFVGVGKAPHSMMDVNWFPDPRNVLVVNAWWDVASVKRYEASLRIYVWASSYRFQNCPSREQAAGALHECPQKTTVVIERSLLFITMVLVQHFSSSFLSWNTSITV